VPDNKINTMRCPFRTDKDGTFCECYGKDCMAYYEYSPLYFSMCEIAEPEKQPVTCICKRLAQPVTYSCG